MTAKGPLPQVAICLGPAVFVPGNKAFALATLRHEIEHAAHDQMAVDWLQKWREAGAKGDFRVWLGSQPIAAADRALVGERVDGSTVNTEVLAHLEGFITAFPKEDHAKANPAALGLRPADGRRRALGVRRRRTSSRRRSSASSR